MSYVYMLSSVGELVLESVLCRCVSDDYVTFAFLEAVYHEHIDGPEFNSTSSSNLGCSCTTSPKLWLLNTNTE